MITTSKFETRGESEEELEEEATELEPLFLPWKCDRGTLRRGGMGTGRFVPEHLKRHRNQKGTTQMATQLATLELSVVPIPETQKEIENTLDAPRRISEAIENFEKQRADAEAELIRSLRKDLAAATFNVERAIEQYKAWKARDDALAAKIEIAKQLRTIIEKRIAELKTTQAEALKAVIQRKIEQLEKEAAPEQDKAALLQHQIDALKELLQELEKPATKKKKE
jgi:chromosome segregation ATPase